MNVAERRRGDSNDSPPVRTHAQSRSEIESSRARVPYYGRMRNYGRMRIFSCDTAALGCAHHILEVLPRSLRPLPLQSRDTAPAIPGRRPRSHSSTGLASSVHRLPNRATLSRPSSIQYP